MMHLCRELKYHVVIKFALITNFVDYRNFNKRYLHLRKLFNNPPNTTSVVVLYGQFGWGGFGLIVLDLRVQIQILCLNDLKLL
jgi:hypothetical protein